MVKAGGDEKKLRRIKKKKAPEGFVNWSEQTFDHLIESQPEKLTPRLRITHSMVLSVSRSRAAGERTALASKRSSTTPCRRLRKRSSSRSAPMKCSPRSSMPMRYVRREAEDGGTEYVLTMDLPDDFALDQPLSPFLLAALELL